MTTRNSVLLTLAFAFAMAASAATASAQVIYVSFAQSGGFDANGAWGVGFSPTLSVAQSNALNQCTTRSLFCGDEGVCPLRAGMFAAFASDSKVPGNRAVSCNQPTEALAKANALAHCGGTCQLLWSGSAAGSQAESLDQLTEWVRSTFLRVVGRPISESSARTHAEQLQANQERGRLQEAKDFMASVEFASLR